MILTGVITKVDTDGFGTLQILDSTTNHNELYDFTFNPSLELIEILTKSLIKKLEIEINTYRTHELIICKLFEIGKF
jgi:hypothetical protein